MIEGEILTLAKVDEFKMKLISEEHCADTVEKYLRDVLAFYAFLPGDKAVSKERVMSYKKQLTERYKASSANSMLVAVNSLLSFMGWSDCRVKLLKVQRQSFRTAERELTKEEYTRLLSAAKSRRNERLYLLMQTICGTGIRVSEHRFITVETVRSGCAHVYNKGKERVIFIPAELKKPLLDYCRRQGITAGSIFISRNGRPLDRSNIWSAMKRLCEDARVDSGKVYPHNLRHLFALTYYRLEKDIVRLADLLGHSSVETTRIYTATSGMEQKRLISRLGLVGCAWA